MKKIIKLETELGDDGKERAQGFCTIKLNKRPMPVGVLLGTSRLKLCKVNRKYYLFLTAH